MKPADEHPVMVEIDRSLVDDLLDRYLESVMTKAKLYGWMYDDVISNAWEYVASIREKMGDHIEEGVWLYVPSLPQWATARCSACGYEIKLDATRHCPRCGRRMSV